MKTIFLLFLVLFLPLLLTSQERTSSGIPADTVTSLLPPIFPIDTNGTFEGRLVNVSNFSNFRLKHDTLFVNLGLAYLAKHLNDTVLENSAEIADTILFRRFPLILVDFNDGTSYDTITQELGFYWNKESSLPTKDFIDAPQFAKGRKGTKCATYGPKPYWHNGGLWFNTVSHCDIVEICDLENSTTDTWCADKVYTKIFEDNFSNAVGNTEIDHNHWLIGGQTTRVFGQGIDGFAANKNAKVFGGALHLTCEPLPTNFKDDDGHLTQAPANVNFLNGFVSTNFKTGYGKYEIRAKWPKIFGVLPAYWINGPEVEIDGIEFFKRNNGKRPTMTIYSTTNDVGEGTCHIWYSNGPTTNFYQVIQVESTGRTNDWWGDLPDLTDGKFRIFTLVWDPEYVTWWIQDEDLHKTWGLTYSRKFQPAANGVVHNDNCTCTGCEVWRHKGFPNNPDQGVHLNLQLMPNKTSNFWGSENGTTVPRELVVDWVKIYAIDNCGNNVTKNNAVFSNTLNNNVNNITGDVVTLGATTGNEFKIETSSEPTPNNLNRTLPLFVRANDEVRLTDGFSAVNGSIFEATNAFRGNSSLPADCQNITPDVQHFRSAPANYKDAYSVFEETDESIKIFPNPSLDVVRVSAQQNIDQVEVTGLDGKRILLQKFENSRQIELVLPPMTRGLYILKVTLENSCKIYKFIKE